ncbi:MAG: methyl-accepting chemotaxis protein [Burkholderiaceae bacterium]
MSPVTVSQKGISSARVDRAYALVAWGLMLMSLALANWYSTWGVALGFGLPLAIAPSITAWRAPGSLLAKLVVATSFMGFCALHIHQAMGMIEFHFGIFVLLAFLAAYRDWRPIVLAATVIAVHHVLFNYLQIGGYAVYCFTQPGLGIVALHAAYVVVETGVLLYMAAQMRGELTQAREVDRMAGLLMPEEGRIDLAARFDPPTSPTGRRLAELVSQLRSVIERVRAASESVNTASGEIAAGNADLSNRTEQTASSLQQTAASVQHLHQTVQHNADSSRSAAQLALSASEVATRGGTAVQEVVSTMDEITHSSRKISEIIGVIDGIAFQTNILALNAAVEAARAGEQGRGFAVVAAEVRSLARRSADAAKEIKELIGVSVAKVDVGAARVGQAGETMQEILSAVRRLNDIVAEISAASGEQSGKLGEISEAIAGLERMTQQNSALVEQSAAAAESLREQAHTMNESMGSSATDRRGLALAGFPIGRAPRHARARGVRRGAPGFRDRRSLPRSARGPRHSLAPARLTMNTACARLSAPIACRTALTWILTVLSDSARCWAIVLFVLPSSSSRSTSLCRGVICSIACEARVAASSRRWSPVPSAKSISPEPAACIASIGTKISPAITLSSAPAVSSRRAVLGMKPIAPRSSAPRISERSVRPDSTATGSSG